MISLINNVMLKKERKKKKCFFSELVLEDLYSSPGLILCDLRHVLPTPHASISHF